ncbi:MAG: hypothetical protein KIT14_11805 [bacterium]|nr:hypothetical protein [bacterium]
MADDFESQVRSAMEALGGAHAVRHMTDVDRAARAAVTGGTQVPIHTTHSAAAYDPLHGISHLDVEIAVGLPLAKLAPFLDPRGWSRFSPSFAASHAVAPGTYAPLAAQAAGSAWSGYLFEDFQVPIGRFRNILKVRFDLDPDRIVARYDLHHGLSFEFVAWHAPGGVEIDLGEVVATPIDAGRTAVRITKTLAFRDLTPRDPGRRIDHGRWLGYLAPAMMTLHAAETSGFGPLVVDEA